MSDKGLSNIFLKYQKTNICVPPLLFKDPTLTTGPLYANCSAFLAQWLPLQPPFLSNNMLLVERGMGCNTLQHQHLSTCTIVVFATEKSNIWILRHALHFLTPTANELQTKKFGLFLVFVGIKNTKKLQGYIFI